MSPFLPPHLQYDFRAISTPATFHCDEVEDCAMSTSILNSPILRFQEIVPSEVEYYADKGLSTATWHSPRDPQEANEGVDATQKTTSNRSLDCLLLPRKRACTLISSHNRNLNRYDSNREEAARRRRVVTEGAQKEPLSRRVGKDGREDQVIVTVTPDRFSACIPCRKRKIKCIPRGDSHRFFLNGTNTGVCATCVRRKKECYWPKIVSLSPPSATPTSASTELIQKEEEKKEEEFLINDAALGESLAREEGTRKQVPPIDRELVKIASSKEPKSTGTSTVYKTEETADQKDIVNNFHDDFAQYPLTEGYFELPHQAFGRNGFSPGLSSSSSSSSSASSCATSPSLPVSPKMEADFPSPDYLLRPLEEDKFSSHSSLQASDQFKNSALTSGVSFYFQ
ncbi:hypothetical protein CBS101457_001065 [Exobasidium rhododendri]|nr:hypothetical protein CBS101457_001065 [Exobasidium rhododendri]